MTSSNNYQAKVIGKTEIAHDIFGFSFQVPEDFPVAGPGAHIDIETPSGETRQYSLTQAYDGRVPHIEIAVLRDTEGRGGSINLCDQVKIDDSIRISSPRNHFELETGQSHYMLLAGGIGITPLLAMARDLEKAQASYELHVCAKTQAHVPYREMLDLAPYKEHVVYHFSQQADSKRLNIDSALETLKEGTQVYACGPSSFIENVEQAAVDWPAGRLRIERFSAELAELDADSQGSFTIELAKSGQQFEVGQDQSILDVLNQAGVSKDCSCLEGVCGSCITEVVSSGEILHRDACLYDDEKASNSSIAVCVSRGKPGSKIVLNL